MNFLLSLSSLYTILSLVDLLQKVLYNEHYLFTLQAHLANAIEVSEDTQT